MLIEPSIVLVELLEVAVRVTSLTHMVLGPPWLLVVRSALVLFILMFVANLLMLFWPFGFFFLWLLMMVEFLIV